MSLIIGRLLEFFCNARFSRNISRLRSRRAGQSYNFGRALLGLAQLFLLCFTTVNLLAQQVQLTAQDNFGQLTNTAVAGVPFNLNLDVKTTQQATINLEQIAGLERTTHHSNGVTSRLSVINGAAQTHRTYSYLVRVDQPGKYQLGPADVTIGGKPARSNQLEITVLAATEENLASTDPGASGSTNGSHADTANTANLNRPLGRYAGANGNHSANSAAVQGDSNSTLSAASTNRNSTHSAQQQPALVKLVCHQPQVYVGEKIPLIIRMYTNSNDVKITDLEAVQAPDFQLAPVQKGASGVTTLNGSSYFYQDYQQLLTPTKAGDFLIPAVALNYAVPAGRQNWFWLTSYVQRQTYSNSLKLQVKPLPTPATPVNGPVVVGVFTSLQAELDKATLAPGEGTRFSLILTGTPQRPDDLSGVKITQLTLGPELRAYFSKVEPVAPHQLKFEFVLQGLASGKFTIPAQKLVVFNPVTHKYQTLSSKALELEITGSQKLTADASMTSTNLADMSATNSVTGADPQKLTGLQPFFPQTTVTANWPRWLRAIPIKLFWLLLLLPIFGLLGLLGRKLYQIYVQRPPVVRQRALARALKRLHKCQRAAQLYVIYSQLFSRLGRIDPDFRTINAQWVWPQVDTAQQARWQKLWSQILQAAFAPASLSSVQQQAVIEAAQQWIQDVVDAA